MGILSGSSSTDTILLSDGVPARIALLEIDGTVARASRPFVEWLDDHEDALGACRAALETLAAGERDVMELELGGCASELTAVIDGSGRRMILLTQADKEELQDRGTSNPVLEEPLDGSQAIIWLKDIEGRYLMANRRYLEELAIDAEAVEGRTDGELTPARSMEGMRIEDEEMAGREPLDLEYLIGAFEERPAYVALRFALRDASGLPTATCSVAAPVPEAAIARAECERLMRLDRLSRLDPGAIRQALLDEWELTPADGTAGPPLDRDDRVAAALGERDEALAASSRLEEELATERRELERLRADAEREAERALELGGAVAAEQARAEELTQALGRAEVRVGELESELAAIRAAHEELADAAERTRAGEEAGEGALGWDGESQRALSAVLHGRSEWRSVLAGAVEVIGARGGWDAAFAWCAERAHGSMRCGAGWTRETAELKSLTSLVWKHIESSTSAEFGRARNRMAGTCLLDLASAEDPLLRTAAEQGMCSALLLPIRDRDETIAMIELFSSSPAGPDSQLVVALEALALQLGHAAQLLRFADVPRWRVGRI